MPPRESTPTTTSTTLPVALYGRVSDDRDGESQAISRQMEDCGRRADAEGWRAETYADSDLSAFKRGVRRPAFERMLDDLRSGAVRGVLAWKADRLARNTRDLVRLSEACEAAGAFICTVSDGIDTRSSAGQFVLELLVSLAKQESANTSVRARRALAQRAAEGKPQFGGQRRFGWDFRMEAIVEEEACLLREAAARLLAGETASSVCRDWAARGARTVGGRAWMVGDLRRTLTRWELAALRDFRGELLPGTWPPILQRPTVEALRALLSGTRRGPERTWLLSGVLRCGLCGEKMAGHPSGAGARYRCPRAPGSPACGRVARAAHRLEGHVVSAVLAALDGAAIPGDGGSRAEELGAELASIGARMEQLSRDHYSDALISRAEFLAARNALQARAEAARAERAREAGRTAAPQLGRGEWDALGTGARRAVVAAVVERVDVFPAKRTGRAAFDPDEARITWRA